MSIFSIGARVAAKLSRLAAPKAATILSKAKAAGVKGVNSVKDLMRQVKENPATAALVVGMMADLGIDVYDMVTEEDIKNDPSGAAAQLAAMIERRSARVVGVIDKDASLTFGDAEDDDQEMELKRLIEWAQTYFGRNMAVVREQHYMLRKFMETRTTDIDRGLRLFGK